MQFQYINFIQLHASSVIHFSMILSNCVCSILLCITLKTKLYQTLMPFNIFCYNNEKKEKKIHLDWTGKEKLVKGTGRERGKIKKR